MDAPKEVDERGPEDAANDAVPALENEKKEEEAVEDDASAESTMQPATPHKTWTSPAAPANRDDSKTPEEFPSMEGKAGGFKGASPMHKKYEYATRHPKVKTGKPSPVLTLDVNMAIGYPMIDIN